MNKEDKIWICIGSLVCLGVGQVVIVGYQFAWYMYYNTWLDWSRIILGGFVFGIMLTIMMLIYASIEQYPDVKEQSP